MRNHGGASLHERRDLSKGERAMALALLYPDADKGGRGKRSSVNLADSVGFSATRLSQARWPTIVY
jgi:hypothetical protein